MGNRHDATPASPPRRGRPRLAASMVPRILDAAARLFAEREALNVSVRDIAAEAGLPHSAIYRYFTGKDDILRQVLERGRERQIEDDERRRREKRDVDGALERLMTSNRAYALVVARVALAGATATSLGLDPEQSTVRRSLAAIRDTPERFELRTDHDARMVAAAAMALVLGWAVCEDWILDAIGLGEAERSDARTAIDGIMGSMMALAKGPDEA